MVSLFLGYVCPQCRRPRYGTMGSTRPSQDDHAAPRSLLVSELRFTVFSGISKHRTRDGGSGWSGVLYCSVTKCDRPFDVSVDRCGGVASLVSSWRFRLFATVSGGHVRYHALPKSVKTCRPQCQITWEPPKRVSDRFGDTVFPAYLPTTPAPNTPKGDRPSLLGVPFPLQVLTARLMPLRSKSRVFSESA